MKKNEALTPEAEKALIERLQKRATAQGLKPGNKAYTDLQTEFFNGAIAAIDLIFENTQSCITVNIYNGILNGETIKAA